MSPDATAAYATPRLLIEPLLPGDESRLEEIFRRAPDWATVLDRPPTPAAAAEEIAGAAASPGRVIAALRLAEGDEDVGAIGWWSSRPEGEMALLGMLLVKPGYRGRKLAAEALAGLEAKLVADGITELRTAFPRRIFRLHPLIQRLGFREMSIAEHQKLGLAGAGTSLWKKPLAAP
jgi:GNAT superfamily N-acetyltransferase